jgi:hypothetical protein
VVNATDPAYGAAVARMLDEDMAAGEEIRRDEFERRSIWVRIVERLAYSLRAWL